MDELTDRQIDEALERGRAARAEEPRAAAAFYDPKSQRVVVELTNGCAFAFPARSAQGLEAAGTEELSDIVILGAGYGLHWEALDVDLSVPDLLNGLLGTRSFMARHAGKASSISKAAAARENGRKGGRPRKMVSG